ncbi:MULTISPECIES: thiamine phosphate synthase [Bacillaceae]|uniref:Thiamine-phosphate synthase n=1 Tax=Evansella alkalicola TaxID=745819 RepID=A0ABS6JN48_9BACI|nr:MULTISPECIES: thiamine phosphate synthase [Bacillaceae]MBU9719987.1 thiamine phosphate synthase [Bacillus alkalicola]
MARISSDKMRDYLKVYFIAGSPNSTNPLPQVLQQAIEGGVTLFQFREKGKDHLQGKDKEALGKGLKKICKDNNIPFIVNDDVDLAITLDADGVHVGQDDGNVAAIRERIGDRILGVSAHNYEEAVQALADGADYLGVGPVFPTDTKADAEDVCGPDFIAELREQGIHVPIVAIGGITESNADQVVSGKADGMSVISAITKAEDPTVAAKNLLRVWK